LLQIQKKVHIRWDKVQFGGGISIWSVRV